MTFHVDGVCIDVNAVVGASNIETNAGCLL